MPQTVLLLVLLAPVCAAAQSGGAITGQIRYADGEPAGALRVSAMSVQNSDSGTGIVLERITTTDGSGRYALNELSPGRYYIVAGAIEVPTYYPGTTSTRGARIFSITAGASIVSVDFVVERMPVGEAVPPLVIPVPVRPPVSGRVVLDSGEPLPAFLRLYVDMGKGNRRSVLSEDGRRIRGEGTFGATPVRRDGSFSLSLPDGEYPVGLINSLGSPLTASDGYYVKSIWSGATDLLQHKLQVTSAAVPPIVITLTRDKP